ncbi:MAG TPA: hypothetical protein VGN64_03410, partial [Dyadobacter sp.]|nr:hypothetical protein [Dyadobacter sp.]
MTQIDYKRVFSKLSHIMALSHDKKFDQIVQNLITHTLNQPTEKIIKNETDVANRISELYGITVRPNVILSNLDKLIDQGQVFKDRTSKNFHISTEVGTKLNNRLEQANKLESNVRDDWFLELERGDPVMSTEIKNCLWTCLRAYLSMVFEQHGMQTLHLLNPSAKINEEDQKSL